MKEFVLHTDIVGSNLRLKWKCLYGHLCYEWSSQPLLRQRTNKGDLALSSSIFLSGNNFERIQRLCKFLKLPMVSKSANTRFQSRFIIPTINSFWESTLNQNIDKSVGKDTIILGDGRMDSPGFCAKYCTYVTMDYDTNDLIGLEIVDKREVSLKSPTMEFEGFKRTLNNLEARQVKIVEAVTDAHKSITKYVREQHPNKKHTHDVWHSAKGLSKKLTKAAKKKENSDIQPWIKDIITHFWYCIKVSDSYLDFVSRWKGILHHVSGKHTWRVGDGGTNSCEHEELLDNGSDKPILTPGSPSHVAIRTIIWKKQFLQTIVYVLNFRSTAVIENFNNIVLKYACTKSTCSIGLYVS